MKIQSLHTQALDIACNRPAQWDERFRTLYKPIEYAFWRSEVNYYLYLNALVRILKPKKVLELGTNEGKSALFMLVAMPEQSQLITIDNQVSDPPNLALCKEDKRLVTVYGDSLDLSSYNGADLGGVDLMFIDTEHQFDQLSQEWGTYYQFLNLGATVVLDDIHINDGMERFWQGLNYPKVDASDMHAHSGFGVFRYE